LLEDAFVRASWRCVTVLAVTLLGCSAEIEPGRSTDRVGRVIQPVIGGVPSGAEHDGVVVLAHFVNGARLGHCSATLVAPNLLLTARHCVSNADSSVACNTDGSAAVGALIHEDYAAADLEVFVAKDGVPPPLGDETKASARGAKLIVDTSTTLCNHDVAFVLLDRPVDAPIATLRLSSGPTAVERVTIVGWGVDETGAMPATRRMREGVAVTGIGPTLMPGNTYGIGNAEVMFGEAACLGDSGGPAFTRAGVLVGVASRVGNGQPRDPANNASTCTGTSAHSIYTHLGESDALLKRAFDEAGNVPVVEADALALAPPRKQDPKETTVGADIQDPSPDAPNAQILRAQANVDPDEPELRPLQANCSIGASRGAAQGSGAAAGWLALIAVAIGARLRRRAARIVAPVVVDRLRLVRGGDARASSRDD
jgi:hypothetical protein